MSMQYTQTDIDICREEFFRYYDLFNSQFDQYTAINLISSTLHIPPATTVAISLALIVGGLMLLPGGVLRTLSIIGVILPLILTWNSLYELQPFPLESLEEANSSTDALGSPLDQQQQQQSDISDVLDSNTDSNNSSSTTTSTSFSTSAFSPIVNSIVSWSFNPQYQSTSSNHSLDSINESGDESQQQQQEQQQDQLEPNVSHSHEHSSTYQDAPVQFSQPNSPVYWFWARYWFVFCSLLLLDAFIRPIASMHETMLSNYTFFYSLHYFCLVLPPWWYSQLLYNLFIQPIFSFYHTSITGTYAVTVETTKHHLSVIVQDSLTTTITAFRTLTHRTLVAGFSKFMNNSNKNQPR